MGELHVAAVLDLITSHEITEEQANALNKALLTRSVGNVKTAFGQLGDAFRKAAEQLPKPDDKP